MSAQARRAPLSYLPYVLILCLTVLLAAAPNLVSLPVPDGATAATTARFSLGGGPEETVALPHKWPQTPGHGLLVGRYRVSLAAPSREPLYLLIPAAQHTLSVKLGDLPLQTSEMRPWGEPTASAPYMLPLPRDRPGTVELEITLTRESGTVAGYLSEVYLADESALEGVGWIWSFVSSGTRTAIIALQTLVVFGIATVWLARPRDPITSWLLLIGVGSLIHALASAFASSAFEFEGQSYLVFGLSAFGLLAVGLALSIAGAPRPSWLKVGIVAVPLSLAVFTTFHLMPPLASVLIGVMFAIFGHLIAAVLLVRNALQVDEWDRALLAVPFFLVAWYGLRDMGIVVGAIDGALLLSAKIRPVTIIAVLTLLMRRLVSSLEAVDRSNETLRQRLAAQERELSALHAKEKALTAQTAREHERGRLMRDLHDGLSGHLVSIIALSQEQAPDPKSIERAARGALDDLRLVINSLDLEDGDLLLALAGLRERLEPQLRRLGVELAWSMERLPPVSGVSPGNALSILRILQEALTNALKHGAAGRISVEGGAAADGSPFLRIGNELAPASVTGKGHGLRNMQRRAAELGGSVSLDRSGGRALLTLVLPPHLAD
jgi:signal transduction histidine kinase